MKKPLLLVAFVCLSFPLFAGNVPEKILYDFETGDLQGWRIVAGEFSEIVTDREVFHNTYPQVPGNKYNKVGKYFLSTVEQKPGMPSRDAMTGIVESPSFVITGPVLKFRIGGGNNENDYLSLCVEAEDGTASEVRKTRGRGGTEIMTDEAWDVAEFIGRRAFLRVVDLESGAWGYVALDQVEIMGVPDIAATEKRFAGVEERRRKERLAGFFAEYNLEGLLEAVNDQLERFGTEYEHGEAIRESVVRLIQEAGTLECEEDFIKITAKAEELKREIGMKNPLVCRQPICFVARRQYDSKYHAIDTLFNSDEYHPEYHCDHKNFFTPGSFLKILDAKTGETSVLLESADGVIRDPDIYFDGRKILFAWRKNRDEDYKIWEMTLTEELHKKETVQRTFAHDVADFDPIYLADDSILFSSTREPKYNMCSRDIAANLYRMEADGANIVRITKNTLFEHNAEQLPDGRIMYHRWEYVDRNFGDAHAVWVVNPDGTNQSIYWGNNTSVPGAVYNPRLIPGTSLLLCIFGPHHYREQGAMAIVDRQLGLDGPKPVLRTWPADHIKYIREAGGFDCDHSQHTVPLKYEDPFPLDEKYFLCSREITPNGPMGIFLIDVFGNEILLHREADPAKSCFDAMPLRSRPRPEVLTERRDYEENGEGTVYLANVYEGTHMANVPPGSVKRLRIVESPEKRHWSAGEWYGQGYTAPGMNWHSLENKRILGTVPVEADGSASFRVPADTFFYVQALDADGKMVQTMRSGTVLQSGETVSCTGCHEDRLNTPRAQWGNTLAMKRTPSVLEPWYGPARKFGFLEEVQPVFDEHCAACHDYGTEAGKKLLLARDADLVFNAAYVDLHRKGYVGSIGAGPAELLPAYAWGSHKSRLIRILDELQTSPIPDHQTVKLSAEDRDRVITWIDLNGVYYPDYACAYPDNLCGRCPLTPLQLARLTELTGIRFYDERSFNGYRGPYVSFDRPEKSPCLERIPDKTSAAYIEALAIIRAGAETLQAHPRCGTPGFTPCEADMKREVKYEYRREIELLNRKAIREGEKHYEGE